MFNKMFRSKSTSKKGSKNTAALSLFSEGEFFIEKKERVDGKDDLIRRDFISGIPQKNLKRIQKGVMNYQYRGILCNKNPFDMALYQMLLYRERFSSIVEIGTKAGGSALWLKDTCRAFGLDTKIVSVDIVQTFPYEDPDITFLQGDGKELEKFFDTIMLNLKRPLLVIEDADHMYETTREVLSYFASKMRAGEYIVVEDGVCESMGNNTKYNGGPNRAVAEFLNDRNDFVVDYFYCDYFGHNVTWCPNGYLKKL